MAPCSSIQNEVAIANQNPLRLRKLQAWFRAFVQAINYGPRAIMYAIRTLRKDVAALESRLIELE